MRQTRKGKESFRPGLLTECGISMLPVTLFILVETKGNLLDPITEISGVDSSAEE